MADTDASGGSVRMTGGCHCGALRLSFVTRDADALRPRACQCTFCRKHGACTVSDPEGRARVILRAPEALARYRFGRRSADFFLCARCGVYLGAHVEDEGGAWMTASVNALDARAGGPSVRAEPTPVTYDDESDEERLARRKARWTPADVVTIAAEPADAPEGKGLLAAYFDELRTVLDGFEPARSVSADPGELTPPRGTFLVARVAGRPVACGGLKTFAPNTGEIKRMYIIPEARARGLDRDLLDALESDARALGMTRLVLDTAGPLSAAARLYRGAGYTEIPAYNANPFASL